MDSGEKDIEETDSLSCGSLVNDLAMLYYTKGLSEKSLRSVMGLLKTYVDYDLPKDQWTIIACATETKKFAVETNSVLYIGVEEALSRVETMCGHFETHLDICLSTDGLPILSSSKKNLADSSVYSSTTRSGISGCCFFHERCLILIKFTVFWHWERFWNILETFYFKVHNGSA